jgi:hypothetical protein
MGPPVAAFYGSNVFWPQVPIIVDNSTFEDTLRADGFDDTVHYYEIRTMQTPEFDIEGKEAVK